MSGYVACTYLRFGGFRGCQAPARWLVFSKPVRLLQPPKDNYVPMYCDGHHTTMKNLMRGERADEITQPRDASPEHVVCVEVLAHAVAALGRSA